jgi:hypothetical protein
MSSHYSSSRYVATDTPKQDLSYNIKQEYFFDFAANSRIYCGNLAFTDFSSNQINAEEKKKFDNCINNMDKVSKSLFTFFK